MEIEMVADVAVNKFQKVINLLGRTRTGHARFQRAPVVSSLPVPTKDIQVDTKVYNPTPIQQVLPSTVFDHSPRLRKESAVGGRKTISFSYSPEVLWANSFNISLLTGETESKHASSSSTFQITILSLASSSGKPPQAASFFVFIEEKVQLFREQPFWQV
ncbi:PREDICTED: probable WRKY transcription factor 7 isoform X1 [Ipomoea nil]|uniref:probable WRKY transcription factor 7 isoform X1 n=1 Tax=Ipomoea nil TaxID=35883 RepID=UPI000901E61F|nr:PREDICTED: probable WRKY transcription factor 7 isoform X1 [Ipomoea nil]